MSNAAATTRALQEFAVALAAAVTGPGLQCDPAAPWRLLADAGTDRALLDLTPVAVRPEPVDAAAYFDGVRDVRDLLDGYAAARRARRFEDDLDGLGQQPHRYADDFLQRLLEAARRTVDDADALRIARLAARLDVYTAVKSVESLLHSRTDRLLLRIAGTRGWQLHFDHLAIRAGTATRCDAERVVALLQERHGYVAPQIDGERVYRFADGWSALPQYKLLENGELLRVFVDQSDGSNAAQIIQHWNRAYGFTAHHLAIRATRMQQGVRQAVPLAELAAAMSADDVEVLTATGGYTQGLLEQVFTCPMRTAELPADLVAELQRHGVADVVRNGKLLELISRREMASHLASAAMSLWGLTHQPTLHSMPVFGYFLPAQAADVIRTSVSA